MAEIEKKNTHQIHPKTRKKDFEFGLLVILFLIEDELDFAPCPLCSCFYFLPFMFGERQRGGKDKRIGKSFCVFLPFLEC